MKFLVFIVLVVSLWYVMRWIQEAAVSRRVDQRSADRATGSPRQQTVPRATDMKACSRCGAYVPAEFPTSCGRQDCPYPGVG
jgi:uncharacterized protein